MLSMTCLEECDFPVVALVIVPVMKIVTYYDSSTFDFSNRPISNPRDKEWCGVFVNIYCISNI